MTLAANASCDGVTPPGLDWVCSCLAQLRPIQSSAGFPADHFVECPKQVAAWVLPLTAPSAFEGVAFSVWRLFLSVLDTRLLSNSTAVLNFILQGDS